MLRSVVALVCLLSLVMPSASADPGPYPGRSYYPVYNGLVSRGPAVPHLATHVPVGLAYYPAKDWLLLSMRSESGRSALLTVIARSSGQRVKSVVIPGDSLGIAVGRHLWVSASMSGRHVIRRYSLARLASAASGTSLSYDASFAVRASSYVAVYGSSLYVGTESGSYGLSGTVYRYAITSRGGLPSRAVGTLEVPGRVRGMVVTADRFVFSRSGSRDQASLLTVWNRTTGRASTIAAPSMAAGVAKAGSRVFLAFASGADPYDGPDHPARNVIKSFHHAAHSALAARVA